MNERTPDIATPEQSLETRALVTGSKDGEGAGDHDQPFDGFRPGIFNTRQLARLLILRGRVLEAKLGRGPLAFDL